jgi:hypothetical protein
LLFLPKKRKKKKGKRKKYSLEERNVFLKLVITIPTLKKKGSRENIILSPM